MSERRLGLDNEADDGIDLVDVGEENGYIIGHIAFYDGGSYGLPDPKMSNKSQKEWAERIVNSVNSHDQLVEMLKIAHEECSRCMLGKVRPEKCSGCNAYKKRVAVLKAAGEKV